MKNLFKLFVVLSLIIFQNCMSQNTKKYIEQYNDVVPKLQKIANQKITNKSVYQDFESFIGNLESNGVKIIDYGYDGKVANSREVYIIRLFLIENNLTDIPNKTNGYQL